MHHERTTLYRADSGDNIVSGIVGNAEYYNIGGETGHTAEIVGSLGSDGLGELARMLYIAATYSHNIITQSSRQMSGHIAGSDEYYPGHNHSPTASLRHEPICTFSHLSFAGSTGLRVSAE